MADRFAVLEFVKTEREIPVKLRAIEGAPPQVFDWYVRKFNPFTLESIDLLGQSGYRVRLPFTCENAKRDREKAETLTRLTLESLLDYGVVIALPPAAYPYEFPRIIRLATGKYLYPFFITDAIKRILATTGRDAAKAEIAVIAGARKLTEAVIDCLYPDFNYISLILDSEHIREWEEKCDAVYDSAGLNIGIYGNNREVFKTADVIINLSDARPRHIHNYKRAAAYFSMDNNHENYAEVASRRADLLSVRNLLLKCGGKLVNLETLELAMYTGNPEYRTLFSESGQSLFGGIKAILEPVELYRIDVSHFKKNYIYF